MPKQNKTNVTSTIFSKQTLATFQNICFESTVCQSIYLQFDLSLVQAIKIKGSIGLACNFSSSMDSKAYNQEVDLKYFINLVFTKKVTWKGLRILLDALTTTLAKSKELNEILLEELEALETKQHKIYEDGIIIKQYQNSINLIEIESECQDQISDYVVSDPLTVKNENDDDDTSKVENQEVFDSVTQEFPEALEKFSDEQVISNLEDENRVDCGTSQSNQAESEIPEDISAKLETKEINKTVEHQNDEVINEYEGAYFEIADSRDQEELSDDASKLLDVKDEQNDIENEFKIDNVEDRHNNGQKKNGKSYECKRCSKLFSSKTELGTHAKSHIGERIHQCEYCPKNYTSRRNLMVHQRIHNVDTSFGCETCGKRFPELCKLKGHQVIHSGERPFQCQNCGKTFNDKSNLKTHMILHSKQKEYKCTMCPKVLSHPISLKNHEKSHSDGFESRKSFGCQTCRKLFSAKSTLKLHERIHTGEKPFDCKICKKAFISSNELKKHERVHTGEKPYVCKTCTKAFSRLDTLKLHGKIHLGK